MFGGGMIQLSSCSEASGELKSGSFIERNVETSTEQSSESSKSGFSKEVRKHEIKDEHFNMVAFFIEAPANFQVKGRVPYIPYANVYYPKTDFVIFDQEKEISIRAFPNMMMTDKQGSMAEWEKQMAAQMGLSSGLIPAQSPEEAMKNFVIPAYINQMYQEVRILSNKFEEIDQTLITGEKKRVKLLETNISMKKNGKPFKGTLAGIYENLHYDYTGLYGAERLIVWGFDMIVGYFAPEATFEAYKEESINIMKNSVTANPEWSKVTNNFIAQQNNQVLDRMNADHRQRMANNKAIFDAGQRAHQERQQEFEAQNRAWHEGQERQYNGTRDFINANTDQRDYRDPNTGESRKLSNQYDYQWTDGTNTMGSNDANFDPNKYDNIGRYYQLIPE